MPSVRCPYARSVVFAAIAILIASPAPAQHSAGSVGSVGGMGGGHVSSGGHAMGMGAHQHFDARYGHNQVYYTHGYRTYSVPHGGYAVSYNGAHYYCYGGHWWGWYGGAWVVIGAPYGAFVPFLPGYYTPVWWGGAPYYYANDTYYVWSDSDHQYQVVAPPPGIEQANPQANPQADSQANPEGAAAGAAAPSSELYVYPRNGQTPEQIANDKYECHRWAADQSGFDPTQNGGGVSPEAADAKRADYLRAQAACLDGRGYTVR